VTHSKLSCTAPVEVTPSAPDQICLACQGSQLNTQRTCNRSMICWAGTLFGTFDRHVAADTHTSAMVQTPLFVNCYAATAIIVVLVADQLGWRAHRGNCVWICCCLRTCLWQHNRKKGRKCRELHTCGWRSFVCWVEDPGEGIGHSCLHC
jgi:hypothetical protein